jgi:hypothetical protein
MQDSDGTTVGVGFSKTDRQGKGVIIPLMFRRWLIRSLALTLLTLCVVVWVGSYRWYFVWKRDYIRGGGYCGRDSIEINFGQLEISRILEGMAPLGTKWGIYQHGPYGPMAFDYSHSTYHFAGFAFTPTDGLQIIMVPFYFPTLLSAALLWLVWRKTKPNYNGKGFPVEPTAKAKET